MPTAKQHTAKQPTAKQLRAKATKLDAEAKRAYKLNAIAERRAKAAKMSKSEFVAQIVKGKFAPITQEDIANEPNPEPKPPADAKEGAA